MVHLLVGRVCGVRGATVHGDAGQTLRRLDRCQYNVSILRKKGSFCGAAIKIDTPMLYANREKYNLKNMSGRMFCQISGIRQDFKFLCLPSDICNPA